MILVDSANPDEVREAIGWGWVAGVTTNPTLLAKSPLPPVETYRTLSAIVDGPIFYQLTASSLDEMIQETQKIHSILGDKLVLKIPATPLGFQAAAKLSPDYTCSITAIFAPEQTLLAKACGVRYAIYYHNRAKQWMPVGETLGPKMLQLLDGEDKIEVLAASFKSKDEIFDAAKAGVKHLTIKFDLLKSLMEDDFSQRAADDFNVKGRGIFDK